MKWLLLLPFMLLVPNAYGEHFTHTVYYRDYFDSQGVYTIVGAVKNMHDYTASPTIIFKINGDSKTIALKLPPIFPNKDVPFKIHVPNVFSGDVVLAEPEVYFEKIENKLPSNVEVMYDKTLKKHLDGHLTGRIINKGNNTEYNVKIYATIHGDKNEFLDVAKNIEIIDKIQPGQILNFTMYPDPQFASDVNYYSCFAIGDETIIPLYTIKNGKRFDFRYDSTAAFVAQGFDESGTTLKLYGINSFKIPTSVNFEFPKTSDHEKFQIFVNEKPIKFIQSVDEFENWHVAFDIESQSQNNIVISGFASEPAEIKTAQISELEQPRPNYFIYYLVILIAACVSAMYVFLKKRHKVVS